MSIRQLRARLTRDESGMGIVEILVALMIFSIVAIGMTYSMIAMTRLSGDSQARETAANLAAAEIDRVAAMPDAFNVHSMVTPKQVVVDGITFNVDLNVGWVSANGSTGKCGIGGGNLQYKRVNVTVTWDGMYLQNPVRADSALAPSTRINDPTAGTILVSVVNEAGEGQQGIAVSASRIGAGVGITDPIDPTDVDGCSYVLKAPPANYNLTISKSGYIDTNQVLLPTTTQITVTAGTATAVPLQADQAATFTLKYAANSTRSNIKMPSNLNVTYYGQAAAAPLTENATTNRKLYPWAAGYQAVAGNPATCAAIDPENWVADGTKAAGERAPKIAAAPGGSANLPVPMGVAEVKMPSSSSGTFLTAVAQNVTSDGQPGCAAGNTLKYSFASVTAGSTQNIALPYGTWRLYTGTSLGATTNALNSGVTVLDGVVRPVTGGIGVNLPGGGEFQSNLLTLDPRDAA